MSTDEYVPSDQIDRDRLRELASGATPGPWNPHPRYVWTSELGGIIQNWSEDANAAADMEFIAAARTALPALLDALDQAEAERDRQRAFKNEAHQFADRVIQEVADAAGIRVADDGWALDDITAAIRQARTDQSRAQVDRVRALHQPCNHDAPCRGDCAECGQHMPCDTIRALDGDQ